MLSLQVRLNLFPDSVALELSLTSLPSFWAVVRMCLVPLHYLPCKTSPEILVLLVIIHEKQSDIAFSGTTRFDQGGGGAGLNIWTTS